MALGSLRSLADIWLLHTQDRAAITTAQTRVDALLARDPVGHGQLLHEGLYRIVVPPLTVFYTVDTTQRTVEVSEVWYTPSAHG